MPVQTRNGGQPQPGIVYAPIAPEPKQQHFPSRRRQVTKTYGRRAAPKRPNRTLTQMNFLSGAAEEDPQVLSGSDDDEKEDGDDEKEDGDDEEAVEEAPVAPKRPAVKKAAVKKTAAKKATNQKKTTRTNRRRTTGDVEEEEDAKPEKPRSSKRRKTMGDPPSASSSFHTQTLTQFLSSTSKDDEDIWNIPDSEEEDAPGLDLVKETPKKQKIKGLSEQVKVAQSIKPASATPWGREKKTEIPSSASPATPLLLKYSPENEVTPLKHKSVNDLTPRAQQIPKPTSGQKPNSVDPLLHRYDPENEPSPSPVKQTAVNTALTHMQEIRQKTPRTMVIQDSYSTSHSSPATPTPKAKTGEFLLPQGTVTPAKRLRFELPEDKENITPGRTKPKSPKLVDPRPSQRQPLSVVPDSDDDFEAETDLDTDEDTSIGAPSALNVSEHTFEIQQDTSEVIIAVDENDNEDEDDPRFAAGAETQALLLSSDNQTDHEVINSTPTQDQDENNVNQEEESESQKMRNKTPPPVEDFADDIVEQTPSRTPRVQPKDVQVTEYEEEFTQGYTQGYTQGMESQRVPLETIKATGSITDKSDIIISIYWEHVENMAKRTKTHEFRDWQIPESVHRVWIYVPRPKSELRYMCTFGPAKQAGEIHGDGIGNSEFNKGTKRSKFGFEVLNMYELNNPVSLQVMRQNGWPTAPQKFSYVPPAVVGQLTSNLRCELWGEEAEQDIIYSSQNVTESQEIDHQIRSDIDHATQLESSDQAEIAPSSQSPPRATRNRGSQRESTIFARPALPKTVPASSRSQPASQSQRSRKDMRPSQATTISQMSSSSPHGSPGRSMALPSMVNAQRSAPVQLQENSSPAAHEHSLRSSQFPTKSQMLPDSLVNGEIQEPPPIIWDSEDESD